MLGENEASARISAILAIVSKSVVALDATGVRGGEVTAATLIGGATGAIEDVEGVAVEVARVRGGGGVVLKEDSEIPVARALIVATGVSEAERSGVAVGMAVKVEVAVVEVGVIGYMAE